MPDQNPRQPFPAWRLINGIKNASDDALDRSSDACEYWSWYSGGLVVVGLIAEVIISLSHPSYDSVLERWGSTLSNALVFIGVAGEIQFSRMGFRRDHEIKRRSDGKVAAANDRAAKADLARAELEAKLLPRMLSQDQWNFIQGLRGGFAEVSIAFETDAETQWFASKIRDALFSAGIRVTMYSRAPDVHSFATLIFEPSGFEGARPKTVEPLIEIFRRGDAVGSLAVITEIPSDIALSIENTRPEMRASLDAPMIIVGGRFVLPPPHLENAAKAPKAARDALDTPNKQ
jgi:hypothetical protein